MKFVIQIGVLLLALSLLLLAFKLLVKSRLLPLLIWCGLGWKLYPQWSAAHPFIFYGVLAALALVTAFSWLGPWLERRREEKRFENHVRSEGAHHQRFQGRKRGPGHDLAGLNRRRAPARRLCVPKLRISGCNKNIPRLYYICFLANYVKGIEEMKDYIIEKISEFEKKYHLQYYLNSLASVDSEISKMWKQESSQNNECWRRINTNDDVIQLVDFFDRSVRFVEENVRFGDGHIEDGYNMALAGYRAIQGFRKMAEFIDPKPWNKSGFAELSETEVDTLFNRMNEIAERMNKQNLRRAMQD